MSEAKNTKIRTRIAPSPTGFAHVGTAYIALFNYAFSRKKGGVFVLRLEDTDVKREIKGAEKAIYDGLRWLGLDWDEGPGIGGKYGPYKQSERLSLYRQKAQELVGKGLAYNDKGAVRFKNTVEHIKWDDLVRGEISFPGEEVTDFVLMKSDGFPTYHFAVVVDDIEMAITHVIRGEDHISNTPKHLALFAAFGVKAPAFGHLPTLRNMDTKKKLSKRRDTVDIRVFKDRGYLPEALLNFLYLQGWSHPEEKEIFSLEEFIKKFDIERVNKAGPSFDTAKLDWINGEYLRQMSIKNLQFIIYDFFNKKYSEDRIKEVLPLVQTRISTLREFGSLAGFFFERPKYKKNQKNGLNKKHIKKAIKTIQNVRDWNLDSLNTDLMDLINKSNFKTGDFFMDLRIAVTGSRFTPPINESIIILGKEETLRRLNKLIR